MAQQLSIPARVLEGAAVVRVLPATPGQYLPLPRKLDPSVATALADRGIDALWTHQAEALAVLRVGGSVALATPTGSGKSLVYQVAAADAVATDERAVVLYLAPTKALGHDQARALRWTGLRVGVLDGDTEADEREWIAAHAQVVITNPDLLNVTLLPRHQQWHRILRRLRLLVIDECHTYRGVFGSHSALVMRRLLRLARAAGADPQLVAASATVGEPAELVRRLTGVEAVAITSDGSPHGRVGVVLREPGEAVRSSRTEAAEVLADFVEQGARCLAFVPSRAGAESMALRVKELVPDFADGVRAYRAGLLAEERREIESALRSGRLRAVATTNALELGVDIAGVDAVVVAGWPGRRASFWQQVGRAGRAGADACAVLVADEDPLDHYLLSHPEAVFGEPCEATVIDASNPRILRPHLVAAAAEAPLRPADLDLFGPASEPLVDDLVAEGTLRRRPSGVFWPQTSPPERIDDIRAIGGSAVRIVEVGTGRLLGTVEAASAPATMHVQAVYVHQGEYYTVVESDFDDGVAFVRPCGDEVFTMALTRRNLDVVKAAREVRLGAGRMFLGEVSVTSQVYAFQRRRRGTGEVLSTHPLEAPEQELRTAAVWWTWPDDVVESLPGVGAAGSPGASAEQVAAGAAHAAEHAAIGLLPLYATCDRWDVGGLSTALHPATGRTTVFVYDGYPGGMGYAERGFEVASSWLAATAEVIGNCGCLDGCPKCVQSPKCGNGNEPLDPRAAAALLRSLLE